MMRSAGREQGMIRTTLAASALAFCTLTAASAAPTKAQAPAKAMPVKSVAAAEPKGLAIDILKPGEIVDPGSFSWAQGTIPRRSSGEGRNIAPDLYWNSGPPDVDEKVKDHVVLVESLGPGGAATTHWIVLGLQRMLKVPEGGVWETPPPSVRYGLSSDGKQGYSGPKPGKGVAQECVIEVFALDRPMSAPAGTTRAQVLAEMKGHVLAGASLKATYTGGSPI